LILDAIPERSFNVGVEVGCAEGQFSHLLASRVDRLVACDFSAEAVDRAMVRNTRHSNIEFVVHDIRDDPVVEHADLFVFSDVLYYLTPQEITNVIESTFRATEPGGVLLFANEWADHYRNLTSPDETIQRIEQSGQWRLLSQSRLDTGPAATLTIACYEREAAAISSQ